MSFECEYELGVTDHILAENDDISPAYCRLIPRYFARAMPQEAEGVVHILCPTFSKMITAAPNSVVDIIFTILVHLLRREVDNCSVH